MNQNISNERLGQLLQIVAGLAQAQLAGYAVQLVANPTEALMILNELMESRGLTAKYDEKMQVQLIKVGEIQ